MAGLPRDCLQIAPVFSKVGVDFFGPLKVKHLRKQEKRYGCLFTCLVTRAVHLEVAFDLSTDSIMCVFAAATIKNSLRRVEAIVGILYMRTNRVKAMKVPTVYFVPTIRWFS